MKYPHNYLNHFRRASMLTENKLSNSSYLEPSTNGNTARILQFAILLDCLSNERWQCLFYASIFFKNIDPGSAE